MLSTFIHHQRSSLCFFPSCPAVLLFEITMLLCTMIAYANLGVHEWSLDCVRELKELALTYVDMQQWTEAER
jgi:hypothetical protein